jgi:hypothetical protein
MGKGSITAEVLILGVILNFMAIGCQATINTPREPLGISNEAMEGAQISKVSIYMKTVEDIPRSWADMTVKNLSETSQKFNVVVKIDDELEVAVPSKKPIEPNKEETISVMTLGKSLPEQSL